METEKIWAPDPTDGYVLAKIIDYGSDGVTAEAINSNKVSVDCIHLIILL